MPSIMGNSADPFITITSLAKPDPQTRRFIRSHVMRGKNAGKFRNSRQWPDPPTEPSTREKGAVGVLVSKAQREADETAKTEGWTLVTPHKIASELSMFGFGGEMKPYALGLIHRAFTVVKPATYALQELATASPDDDGKLFCFANLTQHPGILHSTLFATQAFHDLAVGQAYGTVARHHLAKALGHLQKSLDDQQEAMGLSTMAIVTALAMAAVVAGDLHTATKHMDGLQRIVELRGGLQSLGLGSMIEHKARSIDIGLAMGLGNDLRFTRDDDLSWSSQIAQGRDATRFPELEPAFQLSMRPDPRLLNIWADLRAFSKLVNDATARRRKVPAEIASRLATSVPHRLLRLGREEGWVSTTHQHQHVPESCLHPAASLHELLRLCMLAYVKMLLMKLPGIGRKMTFLADGLRGVLTAWQAELGLRQASGDVSRDARGMRKLVLWAAVVAGVSIFEDFDEEEWLGELLGQSLSVLGLRTWAEARDVLKEFLWIDVVFDQPGKLLFQQVLGNLG